MSDLRFMAAIYQRQKRCAELFKLWEQPPAAIKKVIDSHSWDFELLKIEVAHQQEEWKLLETTCTNLISKIWQESDPAAVGALIHDICTITWKVWQSLLDAASHLYSQSE